MLRFNPDIRPPHGGFRFANLPPIGFAGGDCCQPVFANDEHDAMTIEDVLAIAPVIPVLAIEDPAHARPIAEALVAGGLGAIEVTLRGPAAIEAIAEIASVEGVVVGAGAVASERQLDQAIGAGARFIASPGLTETFGAAAMERAVAFLPGIANAGDIMRALELGLDHFQFFPAEALGLSMLKALAAPFSRCRFRPMGGLTAVSAAAWLADPAVCCVGGEWLVDGGTPDLAEIEARARAASALRWAQANGPE